MKTFKEYLREQGGPSLPFDASPGQSPGQEPFELIPNAPVYTDDKGTHYDWEKYRELEDLYGIDPQHPLRRRPTQVQPWWHPWNWGLPQEFDWILPHIPPFE